VNRRSSSIETIAVASRGPTLVRRLPAPIRKIAAFIPGASPPLVKTQIRFVGMISSGLVDDDRGGGHDDPGGDGHDHLVMHAARRSRRGVVTDQIASVPAVRVQLQELLVVQDRPRAQPVDFLQFD
jgi:hypothetical protein